MPVFSDVSDAEGFRQAIIRQISAAAGGFFRGEATASHGRYLLVSILLLLRQRSRAGRLSQMTPECHAPFRSRH